MSDFKNEVVDRLSRIEELLYRLNHRLETLATEERRNTMTVAELKTQVEKNTTLEESAVQLITGIAAQLAAAKDDPAAIQALADELTKSGSDLAAAITANTPASPSAGASA